MDFIAARHAMVESQVRTNRIVWPELIQAMRDIPREKFVPNTLRSVAYIDQALHLGDGRFELSPMLTARLIDLLSPTSSDLTLVVGAGFGYTVGVMSFLSGTVIGQEPDDGMRHHAEKELALLSCDNTVMVPASFAVPTDAYGPFDNILLCGAVATPPLAFFNALVPRGRCVSILQKGPVGHAVLWTKQDFGQPAPYVAFDGAAPYLPNHEPVETFVL